MNIQFDIAQLIEKRVIENELDFERALIADRKLRVLAKEHPELKTIRKKLPDLIERYEREHWSSDSNISNDKSLFKKLNEDIWEFRTLYKKTYYRLFAFWDRSADKETLVLATHGLIKKTGKIPKSELEHAKQIRKKYFKK